MKKITTYALRCLALIALTAIIGSSTMNAQKPVKRVLVEEGTGAWCGFCPRGLTTLLQMIDKYPDKVIAVAMHDNQGNPANDYMAIAEEGPYAAAFINGFPNMTIDRKRFSVSGAKIGVSDGAIPGPIQTQMVTPAKVGVSLENLVYSPANRTLTVDVKAEFVSPVTGDIRFNVYIVEDSVKGTGQGWDQHNYMSKTGSSPDKDSPWYNLPPNITGFYHRHVLRAMLGGTWGTDQVIPSSVASGGVYTKTYTYKVPANFNSNHINVVGIVQMYDANADKREILNAVEQGLTETKLPLVSIKGDVTDPYLRAATSSTITKKVTFTNTNATDVDVDIAVDFDKSVIPGGWGTKVEPATATIPAGGTFDALVTIETDGILDFAKAIVTATPKVENAIPDPGVATVYALSSDIKFAAVNGFNPFTQVFSDAVKALNIIGDKTKIFNWTSDPATSDEPILQAYSDQFDVVVFNFNGGMIYNNSLDLVNGLPLSADATVDYPNIAKYLKKVMDGGKRVFVSLPNGLALNTTSPILNADATEFFATLGVSLGKKNQHFTVVTSGSSSNYTPSQFTVSGVTGEICAGITATGNATNNGYTFWTNSMKLTPGSKAVPIFTMSGSASDILGVRYEGANKSRAVLLTFDMAGFGNTAINSQIMDKTINWLAEGLLVKPKVPVISNIDDIDFGEVELTKSKDMTVNVANEGDADLVISNIEIKINKNDFQLKPVSLPLTIKPHEQVTLTITYAPKEKGESLTGILSITSNDPLNDTKTSELIGSGKAPVVDPNSVFTPAEQAKTIIGMTAGPNPATTTSTISYTVGGVSPQVVEMYVVDVRGARVATLVNNRTLAPGNYTANINATDLASGSYRIVAHTAAETVQLPLVINR